jgi:hypothetical protein
MIEDPKLVLATLDSLIPRLYDHMQIIRANMDGDVLLALTTALKAAWDVAPRRVGEDAERLGLHSWDITDEAITVALYEKIAMLRKIAQTSGVSAIRSSVWRDIMGIVDGLEVPEAHYGRVVASTSEDDILADDDGQADPAIAAEIDQNEEDRVFGLVRAEHVERMIAHHTFPAMPMESGQECPCVTSFGKTSRIPEWWVAISVDGLDARDAQIVVTRPGEPCTVVLGKERDGVVAAYKGCPLCHGTGKVV